MHFIKRQISRQTLLFIPSLVSFLLRNHRDLYVELKSIKTFDIQFYLGASGEYINFKFLHRVSQQLAHGRATRP